MASITPKIQKSMPIPGAWGESESGSNAVQPALPGPLVVRKPEYIVSPPHTNSQKPSRLTRGAALSAAPTWSGTR